MKARVGQFKIFKWGIYYAICGWKLKLTFNAAKAIQWAINQKLYVNLKPGIYEVKNPIVLRSGAVIEGEESNQRYRECRRKKGESR